MIFTLSSDVLAYVSIFLPSDRNIVNLFICHKPIKSSQFLSKVNLTSTYQQSDCDQYKTLFEIRKRIRCWYLPAYTLNAELSLPPWIHKLTFGVDFNQIIDKVIFPSSLQQITFSGFFNQNIDNVTFPITYYFWL
jgi:hypothetical protein